MLRKEVVDAAADGRFHVYAVTSVDECMALLTGQEPGERDVEGGFAEGTLNRRIRDRLLGFAQKRRIYESAIDKTAADKERED